MPNTIKRHPRNLLVALSLIFTGLLIWSQPSLAEDAITKSSEKERYEQLATPSEESVPTSIPEEFFLAPSSGDLSYMMLKNIFGGPVDTVRARFFEGNQSAGNATETSKNVTLITALSGIMFAVSIVFGAILMTYIMVVGLLKTTQTGIFLGKWDGMFLPIRAVMGLAMSFPLPGFGGLTAVQVATMAVAILGIAVGSAVFNLATKTLPQTGLVTYNQPEKLNEIARVALVTTTCVAAKSVGHENYSIGWYLPDKDNVAWLDRLTDWFDSDSTRLGLASRDEDGNVIATCGQYKIPSTSIGDTNVAATSGRTTRQQKIYVAEVNIDRTKLNTLIEMHVELFDGGNSDSVVMDVLNGTITPTTYSRYQDIVQKVADKHMKEIARIVKPYSVDQSDEAIDRLGKLGWAAAGSYYWHMERAQDRIFEAMDNDIADSMSFDEGELLEIDSYEGTPEALAAISRALNFSDDVRSPKEILKEARADNEGTWGKAGSWVNDILASGMIGGGRMLAGSSGTNINPMLEMRTLGNTLLNTLMAGKLVVHGIPFLKKSKKMLDGANKVVKKTGGKGKGIASGAGRLLGILDMFAFLAGLLLAYVVPSLPYFMWIVAMGGYIIYVAQAIIAAPLWAIMHMHPEGGDITGKGGSGYPILANLFMRPTLMVIGLFVGMAILRVMGWLVNETLIESINMARSGSVIGPFTFLFIVLSYAVLMFLIAMKSFALIAELPRGVLRWMGVNDQEDLGERETSQQSMAIFSSAGRIGKDATNVAAGPAGKAGGVVKATKAAAAK